MLDPFVQQIRDIALVDGQAAQLLGFKFGCILWDLWVCGIGCNGWYNGWVWLLCRCWECENWLGWLNRPEAY